MSNTSTSEAFRFSAESLGGVHWNTAGAAGTQDDDRLLKETRQELRRIVAEIGNLCHSKVSATRFWPKFLSLVGSALAAEGGVIWYRNRAGWNSITHCGDIDGRLIANAGVPCHRHMIAEIGDSGGPVAVPPGTDWNADEPGNPTAYTAAVVPIPIDADEPIQFMIELFLTPGSGPATQRGYLRFVAQMSDLAADFLRAHRLRDANEAAEFSHGAAAIIADLQEISDARDLYQRLVDEVSRFTNASRVCLVGRSRTGFGVLAVNGTSEVDAKSPVVKSIVEISKQVPQATGFNLASDEPKHDVCPDDAEEESGDLTLRGVAVLDSDGDWRLVLEDERPRVISPAELQRWVVFSRQLGNLLKSMQERTTARLPFPFLLGRQRGISRLRQMFVPLGLSASIVLASIIPVPLVVRAKGNLQPSESQVVYAPREGIVSKVLVTHGEQVIAGQPLIRLVDYDLEQKIEGLASRLIILQERRKSLRDEQVRDDGSNLKYLDDLILQQRSLDEELIGVEAQLEICRQQSRQLELLAKVDGRVDAWQIEDVLGDRPVPRGHALLRIVPRNCEWSIHAKLPEDRLDLILERFNGSAEEDCTLLATATLAAFPENSFPARLVEIGPTAKSESQSLVKPFTLARFSVDEVEIPTLQAGAPVEMSIPCGNRPFAYVVGFDLIRMTVQTVSLYW